MKRASVIRLFTLAALWGASFLFIHVAAASLSSSTLMFARCVFASVFLVLMGALPRVRDARTMRHLAIVGALNSALPFVLIGFAAHTLGASLMAVLNATSPVFGALATAVATRARPPAHVLAGALLGVAGVALVTGASLPALTQNAAVAIACSLAAALSYGIAATHAKLAQTRVSGNETACGSMIAASLFLVVPAGPSLGGLAHATPSTWIVLALLGVACTGVAYLLYFRLIADEGAPRALSVTLLVPLFATLWGALFLDEHVSATTLAGAALVLAGTAITTGMVRR
jgi:drug/metabolite transporter (DMT)-like permease